MAAFFRDYMTHSKTGIRQKGPLASLVPSLWNSPTWTTWGNLGVRLLGFAILLPFALSKLSVEEANLWLLLQAILVLQTIADFGFTPTFTRVVSYAMAGRIESRSHREAGIRQIRRPNLLLDVVYTMRWVYQRLSVILLALLAVLGTLALNKPISALEHSEPGWLAWTIVAISSYVTQRGGMYAAFMQGINQISLYQRWQIFSGLISISGAIAVLAIGGTLVSLVAAMQAGTLIGIFVTRKLAVRYAPSGAWHIRGKPSEDILDIVWPAAWRSGIGVALTFGTVQGAGIIYAQIAPPNEAAAFLLAQRLLRTFSSFANAPFYTRIPTMTKLFALGKDTQVVEIARSGMLQANWTLVTCIIATGFIATPVLEFIGSETNFVSFSLWWLLGLSAVLERVGAMHLQLYSTTNDIRWHIANGVSGFLMILAIPALHAFFGVNGIAIGIIFGYAAFYVPYSVSHSYRTFKIQPLRMDLLASIIPTALILAMVLISTISH